METKFILSVLTSLLLAVFFGGAVGHAMDVNPVYTITGAMCVSLLPLMPAGVLGMAIQKEIWVDYIIENLFMNNEWLKHSFNHDDFVIGGKVVHEPEAGAKPKIVKNRSVFPATVVTRADQDRTYALDEYTSDPIKIPDADTKELSYDKVASVLAEMMEALQEDVGTWMLQNWIPSSVLYTTGADVSAHMGAGVRKLFMLDDLVSAKKAMSKAGIAKTDRQALLDPDMLEQLVTSLRINSQRDSSIAYDLVNGAVKRIEGFELHERAEVYKGTEGVIQAPDWTEATAAVSGALLWQKNCVARAKGDVDFFEDLGNPTHYGDIYSALVRAGGRVRRQSGVIAIQQKFVS
ncbi:MAG: hypothetical protein JKY55_01000 [Aliivibrio sp.]|uniref:hypothetical protein n=1 Tax=Aliivibrio sp. TaxID=1872443 RepID=UPI001A3CE36C|nr:hypothetical protein [Aliivibrio sp.]